MANAERPTTPAELQRIKRALEAKAAAVYRRWNAVAVRRPTRPRQPDEDEPK